MSPVSCIVLFRTGVRKGFERPVLREKDFPVMSTKQKRKLARTFAVISLLVVTGAGFSAVGNASENGTRDPHQGMVQVVVGGGETLWDIASMVADNQDVQSVVDQIASVNHLNTPDIKSGARLWVPSK